MRIVDRAFARNSVPMVARLSAVALAVCGGTGVAVAENRPPEAPVLVSPLQGTIADTLRPALVIRNATDPDGDSLVYDWDLTSGPHSTILVQRGVDAPPQGASETAFLLAIDLTEDTRYCWRARSDDGQATSTYSEACFVVSERNDPPSVPIPSWLDGMVARTTTPVFAWAPSTDPEGEPITYEVEVMDEAGSVVAGATGVDGTLTNVEPELTDHATYAWRVRATDRSGTSSAFSPDHTFMVNAPCQGPIVCEETSCGTVCYHCGPFGIPPECPGCCQASSALDTRSLIVLAVALALGLPAFLRRRRRASIPRRSH